MSYIHEGVGKPKIVFNDLTYHTLPEPVGPERDGLRIYDFEQFTRDQYWSESGKRNNVGRKFIFLANLRWVSLAKESVKKLWKAEKEKDFKFILNEDEPNIYFQTEVTDLRYRFFKGLSNHRAGYTVDLKLRGTVLLDSPGYESVIDDEGYGSEYGEEAGNTPY